MKRREFTLLTALTLSAYPAVAAGSQSITFARVPSEMRWAGVPGASLAAVSLSAIRSAQFGFRDVARHLPVTATTVFEAASLSKPVFAYAVLELVRAGGLDLDRPLDSYLSVPYSIDDAHGKEITARHVLMHTSGLPNWRPEDSKTLSLHFTPGSRYSYSGEGFYFLQTVVEQITGKSTEHFMRQTLDRLGMRESSYTWREAYQDSCASPYGESSQPLARETAALGQSFLAIAKKSAKPLADWTSSDALAALRSLRPSRPPLPHDVMPNVAWSLLTTGGDYGRFVQALLRQPDHPMLKPALRISTFVWRGLGVALQKYGDALAFFHTGSNPGFKAVMFGDLSKRRGVVSFANSNGAFPFNMHALENAVGEQPAVFYLQQP